MLGILASGRTFDEFEKKDPGTYHPRPPPKSLKKGELKTYGIWASTEKLPSRLSFGRGQNVEHVGF
jgi:hypothetical protein